MFVVQNASLNMHYSPSLGNLVSDWLRAKRALPWMRKKVLERKIKMDDGVDISFASKGTDIFTDLWEAQPRLWDPEGYCS